MQCRFWIRGGMLLAGFWLAAASMAFPPEGKYREEIKNPFRGQNVSLMKTLHLRLGGKAEMFFEYKGDKPVLDLWITDEFGGLMEVIRDYRKLKHTGSWRMNGNRILVELTRLEAGDQEANLHSAIEFELFGDELQAKKQDKGDYGDRPMRLRMLERYDVAPAPIPGPGPQPIPIPGPPPANENFDPGKRKGNYAWADEVAGQNGPSILVRRLKLNGDKTAELASEYLGGKPRLEEGSTGLYGSLFAEVVARRKITHKGSWRETQGRVLVELDRIGSGDFAQNVHSALLFDIQGKDLYVREQDAGDYGTRGSPFKKDFNPSSPSLPSIPAPPGGSGPPGAPGPKPRSTNTMELDTEANGGGAVALQGSKAMELSRLRVVLGKNGRFEIRAKGSDEAVLKGGYDLKDDGRVTLEVGEAFGRSSSGGGTLDLARGGKIRKLVVRGFSGDRRFTVTFDAMG